MKHLAVLLFAAAMMGRKLRRQANDVDKVVRSALRTVFREGSETYCVYNFFAIHFSATVLVANSIRPENAKGGRNQLLPRLLDPQRS